MKRQKTEYIVIHCADTYPDMDIGAKEIRGWHVNERKWADIGYHYVIRRNGVVEPGRNVDKHVPDIDEVGAHVERYNYCSIGICMVGGKSRTTGRAEANFTDAQYKALWLLLKKITPKYPKAQVVGHRDLNAGKECPSFDAKGWYAKMLQTKG